MKLIKTINNKNNEKTIDEIEKFLGRDSLLSIISNDFSIFAFKELKNTLKEIKECKFIITKISNSTSNNAPKEYYIKTNLLSESESEIKLKNELKQYASSKECAEWVKNKVKIKRLKNNLIIHKLISIQNDSNSVLIHGTVDFNTNGLGITNSKRLDINTCVYEDNQREKYLDYFNNIWSDDTLLEDVKDKFLEEIELRYKENTPNFIYFKALYNIFKDYINNVDEELLLKSKTGIKETLIWKKLYKFQEDGVIGAIEKLEKYNGCILADSVGLGKTFSALAIIKYYELRNLRVLVLVPKKLNDNWKIYKNNDIRNILLNDKFKYDILNHTDLNRETGISGDIDLKTLNWSNYDLVVIDESHNFRNNNPSKGKVTRYQKLMNDIIKSGVSTKVLMLSATPVNNKMKDIKNQIDFISLQDDSHLIKIGIKSIEGTINNAQRKYNEWMKLDELQKNSKTFLEMVNLDYFKLLDALTIARSRKHIESYYDFSKIGKFPQRLDSKNIYVEKLDSFGLFPSINEINEDIMRLKLAIYSPLSYIFPKFEEEYAIKYDIKVKDGRSSFKQKDREKNVINLIRILLLKRMESSILSFQLTLHKLISKINEELIKIKNNKESIFNNSIDDDFDDDEINEENMIGKNVKVNLKHLDLIKWKSALEKDKTIIEKIYNNALNVTPENDGKLIELKKLIIHKINNPINKGNRKIIIFSAFKDTVEYLYKNISPLLLKEGIYSANISGSGNNGTTLPEDYAKKHNIKLKDFNTILTLFSPISKSASTVFDDVDEFIDVIFATDCISEGQNLQDCDYLINYDIHWNPVKIIQRFGRIDRIGSQNDKIQLVNFWPMKNLDEYINLEQRVKGKMMLSSASSTGDENILNNNDYEAQYRKQQVKQVRDGVVDIENFTGGISMSDLTFSDFKIELLEYVKENRDSLERSPNGLHTVINIKDLNDDNMEEGVIFLLKRNNDIDKLLDNNLFEPHYLVYITNDGEIKLNYINGKKILDYLKKTCFNKKTIWREQVDKFNKNTKDGIDMNLYSSLLNKVVEDISNKREEQDINSIFSRGKTTIKQSNKTVTSDFELICFFVLLE